MKEVEAIATGISRDPSCLGLVHNTFTDLKSIGQDLHVSSMANTRPFIAMIGSA